MKSEYYTLKGYKLRSDIKITEAMEDYLEMIYRKTRNKKDISVSTLSNLLNVRYSSVSKMITRLKELGLVNSLKYKTISLTKEGKIIGKYLIYRHNILKNFFKYINGKQYNLSQVERVEHFIDNITIENIETFINKIKTNHN